MMEQTSEAVRIEATTLDTAIQTMEMNLVALLRPRVFVDGDQWCVLYGENIQEGIAGFGESPMLAVYAFNKAWNTPLPTVKIASPALDAMMGRQDWPSLVTAAPKPGEGE